jgi:hypothetical protein
MDTTCRIVIVEGVQLSGCTTLATALAADLGTIARVGITKGKDDFEWLSELFLFPQPLIVDRFHLTAAIRMAERKTDLNESQWAFLDDIIARRFGRIIMLIDSPLAIETRSCLSENKHAVDRGRIGHQIQHLNRAYSASSVARKGSYRLTQFINPETGERTPQYQRLLTTIKKEMKLE